MTFLNRGQHCFPFRMLIASLSCTACSVVKGAIPKLFYEIGICNRDQGRKGDHFKLQLPLPVTLFEEKGTLPSAVAWNPERIFECTPFTIKLRWRQTVKHTGTGDHDQKGE